MKRTEQCTRIQLPKNLLEWVDRPTLLRLTLEAVLAVEWPRSAVLGADGPGLQPPMLGTLLTYCYATGVYSSEDIERAIYEERTVRYICAHNYPTYLQIRNFRRHYRAQLRQTLLWVFQQAWALRLDQGEVAFEGFAWFEQVLRRQLEETVDEKINLAILLDRSICDD